MRYRSTRLVPLSLFLLFALAAQAKDLDVNDVSYLFPLPASAGALAAMPSLHEGPGAAPWLTREDYVTLAPSGEKPLTPEGIPNPIYDMAAFKVVAVRVDPCAKDDPSSDDCRAELRLVLQPLLHEVDPLFPAQGVVTRALDIAMHLIYEVPEANRKALVDAVWELGQMAGNETTGKPLQVHPVLRREGLDGPFRKALWRVVETHAVRSSLRVATHMFTVHDDEWTFFRTISRDGKLVKDDVPFVGKQSQLMVSPGIPRIEIRDRSTAKDNVNLIVDSLPGGNGDFFKLPEAERKALVDAALRIDNPLAHTPSTTDCASCHAATRSLSRAVSVRDFVNLDDGNPNRYRPPAGTTGKLVGMELDNVYSVRAFGYFRSSPSFTKGVVNDSAKVADGFNRKRRDEAHRASLRR